MLRDAGQFPQRFVQVFREDPGARLVSARFQRPRKRLTTPNFVSNHGLQNNQLLAGLNEQSAFQTLL